MKKFLPTIYYMMMLFSVTFFTSCESDTEKSMVLAGQWQGDFGVYYTYTTNTGRSYTFNSYNTNVVFYPDHDYATYGYGKEVDYYDEGPYTYQYNYFNWEVKYGKIYLDYPATPYMNTIISDYILTNRKFSGYFPNSSEPFCLYKINDFFDWTSSYVNYQSYGYRTNWNNAKARGTVGDSADTTSVSGMNEEGTITNYGNRFSDNK